MLNMQLADRYLYIDRLGLVQSEIKGATSWLGRLICQLLGIRNYRLTRVVMATLQTKLPCKALAGDLLLKAIQKITHYSELSNVLVNLALGHSVELQQQAPLLRYNQHICKHWKLLNQLFNVMGKAAELQVFKRLTYKLSQHVARSTLKDEHGLTLIDRINSVQHPQDYAKLAGDWYVIDELGKIADALRLQQDKIQLENEAPIAHLVRSASRLSKKILETYNTDATLDADIVLYDLDDIQKLKLWKYTGIERMILKRNGGIGHIAVETRSRNGPMISHMMEAYTEQSRVLQHLFLRRFRLGLGKLLTEEARQKWMVSHANADPDQLAQWLRAEWQQISQQHFDDVGQTLKQATNSAVNQVMGPFRFKMPWQRTNHADIKPYRTRMLCSEYAQMSITNRLVQLNQRIRERLDLKAEQQAFNLPIGAKDHDIVLPGKMFKRWEQCLIPVSGLKTSPNNMA